ncbi:MAG: restriction endonuclease subunit S [Phycisphaerales bacterium]|nr:restriction endonuclease subunit S [Phycisphaerales bacterium]
MGERSWHSVRLGELVGIKHGWPFKSDLFSEELTGRPIVVAVGNFQYTGGFRFDSTSVKEYLGEYPADYDLSPGDVLMVMTCQTPGGEILGIPARVPNDGRRYLHNQRLGKVVVKQPHRVSLDYLYWLFLWKDFNTELVASSSGTKIVHTAPSRIEAFRFDLPPLPEQRAIARVRGGLDDKIELNRRMNRTLEDLARGVFRSWFVDFDPVARARPAAAPASPRGTRPSPPRAAHPAPPAFPARLVDSPLGPIPEGWRVGTVGEEVTVVGGSTPSTDEPKFWEGGTHCWVTPRDLSRLADPVVIDCERRITDAGLTQISSGLMPKGTVLMSSRAPIGYLAIADVPVAVNQGFIAMKCDKEIPGVFALRWCEENMDEVLSRAGGTTFAEISKAAFRPIPMIVPPADVLAAFERVAGAWHDRIVENVRQSRSLAALRDALLPQLLSGEVRLRAAEEAVDGALRSGGPPAPANPSPARRGGGAKVNTKGRA